MSTTMTGILLALAGVFLVAYLMRRRARLRWLRGSTPPTNPVLSLILKSTALAMSSVSLGAAIFRVISTDAHVVMLSLGLLALALVALQKTE